MDNRSRRNNPAIYSEEQIKRVLAGSGIDVESDLDADFLIFCPFHPNNRTPAGEINKESGTFFCFSCHHVSDLIGVVMETTGRTYFEAARFIKSKESNVDLTSIVSKKLLDQPQYKPFDQSLINKLNEQALSSDRAMNYYYGRLIKKESVQKFKLGYSEKQDMVTVPVAAPDGTPVGFVGRSVEGKSFKNTPGLPKSKVLFNLHRVKTAKQVYVVESSFDVIRLDQVGMPAVATLGANVSKNQIELLQKYFNSIIVVADNDDAGGNMKDKILDNLGGRTSILHLEKQYKDIGDMSDDDIKKIEYSFDKSIQAMLN